jgi:hypothetical protein
LEAGVDQSVDVVDAIFPSTGLTFLFHQRNKDRPATSKAIARSWHQLAPNIARKNTGFA